MTPPALVERYVHARPDGTYSVVDYCTLEQLEERYPALAAALHRSRGHRIAGMLIFESEFPEAAA
jgi:hypothetical protein